MAHDRPDRPHDPPPEARSDAPARPASGVSRRSFIQTVGISSAAAALQTHAQARAQGEDADSALLLGPGPINVGLTVNDRPVATTVEPDTTLLELLRLNLSLTGSKEICGRGSCGGCSVILDGKLVASCLTLAADAEGARVTTIEGLAQGDTLDPVQESFIRHDGFQCGYCTPGLVMASRALLDENPKPTLDEIRHGLAGNYCRCAAYTNIYNAVLDASGQQPIRDGKDD